MGPSPARTLLGFAPLVVAVEYTKIAMDAGVVSSCGAIYDRDSKLEVRGHRYGEEIGRRLPKTEADADTSLCGTEDRRSFLIFDMSDFSSDAIETGTFHLRPVRFPSDTVVRVTATNCTWAAVLDWTSTDVTFGDDVCAWRGDDDLAAVRDIRFRACDLTIPARRSAGANLCVRLDGDQGRTLAVFTSLSTTHSYDYQLERGSFNTILDTSQPHLIINGTNCGRRYPDMSGPGCSF